VVSVVSEGVVPEWSGRAGERGAAQLR